MLHNCSLALVLAAVSSLSAANPDKAFFFKKGDRVIFLGDSITEQYQYSTYIELFLTTRFPDWNLQFLNAGISGDTATGGARRFDRHILAEKPTAVTIDFGMNDGAYGKFKPDAAEAFIHQTEAMVDMAKKAGIRIALISPNAVEVRNRPALKPYLETQQQFYAPLKEIAAKNGLPFVDQYAVTKKVLEKLADDDAPTKPFPDAVHTNQAGGLLMAHTILTGLNAPALVSDVSIDAVSKNAATRRCTVSGIAGGADNLSFERKDDALPLPMLEGWRELLPYLDNLKQLNLYGLKVTGLIAGKYDLLIDGTSVATFTAEELSAGVNLGNLDSGPIFEQARAVLFAINDKNSIVHKRFRGVVMFEMPDWLADIGEPRRQLELRKRKELIDAKQAAVYELARPKLHKFQLKPAK